jgi:hypothetical protein
MVRAAERPAVPYQCAARAAEPGAVVLDWRFEIAAIGCG